MMADAPGFAQSVGVQICVDDAVVLRVLHGVPVRRHNRARSRRVRQPQQVGRLANRAGNGELRLIELQLESPS